MDAAVCRKPGTVTGRSPAVLASRGNRAVRPPATALAKQPCASIMLGMALHIRPFTSKEATLAALWRYEPPYEIYDSDPNDVALYSTIDDQGYGYYAVARDQDRGELVGFCCFGPEARVKGQEPEPGTLDIGGGIRPDMTSKRLATEAFPSILAFGQERFRPERFRIAVATFNERSTRLCLAAGFTVTRTFDDPGREFGELVRPADQGYVPLDAHRP